MTAENKPTNASLSTMWAIKNFPDLNDFFRVARNMGFQKIELNHQISTTELSQVLWENLHLSSVHEPCPADIPMKELVKNDWLVSSTNEDLRQRGVQAVKTSIHLASERNAPVVVIHCGNVYNDTSRETALRNLYKDVGPDTAEFLAARQDIIHYRSALAAPRLKAVKKSLLELVEYSTTLNVKLGLENRYHYFDIPILEEMAELLEAADPSRIGFIYDVGHAQALDRLGFFPHEEWLVRYSTRMFGCHLHDVIGLTDHFAPGLGEIDFSTIANYLPDAAFRTLELLPANTVAQIVHGIDHLVASGCLHYL